MAVKQYYTVNGEITGVHTIGQSRLDHLPDALGSVIVALDQTLAVRSTTRLKPYGADLAMTGTQRRMRMKLITASYSTYTYDADGLKRYEDSSTGRTTLVWDGTDYLQGRS